MTKINSHPTQQKAQLLVTHFYVKKNIQRVKPSSMGSLYLLPYSHSCNVLYKVQKYWTKNSPVDPTSTIDILSPWFSFDMVQTSDTYRKKFLQYAPHNNSNGCLPNRIRFQ